MSENWKSTRRNAKLLALQAASAGGVFRAWANSKWRSSRLLILCYHGFSLKDEHLWNPGLYLTAEVFRSRLEALRLGGYRVVGLNEGLERLESGTLPPRSVAITVDDGFYDFAMLAYPLLREYNFPCTVYLTTYYCGRRQPVFDPMCSYLLWKGIGKTLDLKGLISEGGPVRVVNEAVRQETYKSVYRYVRDQQLSADEKNELLKPLARQVGVDWAELERSRMLQIMSREEAQELHRRGIDLQLHTHRHRTPRDKEAFTREIRDNAAALREITGGEEPRHFCYPSGDYTPEFFPWLRELGVRSSTTCVPGLAAKGMNPQALPRFLDLQTVRDVEFRAWLSGFAQMVPAGK